MNMTVTEEQSPSLTSRHVEIPGVEQLSLEVIDEFIGVLRINRPDRMNSQTLQMFREHGLAATFLRDSGLRALIITGAGDRAFCAGFDLDEVDVLTEMSVLEFVKFVETASAGVRGIRELPFPVIAAVHGPATGGGFAVALAADIRLVTPSAKFSTAFIKVGLSIGELGVSYNLPRLAGYGHASEIGFTGRLVGADEAVRIGLANRVVPSEKLLDEAITMARIIAANSPGGLRMSKRAIQRNQEIASLSAALELENRGQALMTRTADMPEALAAFKERRPAVFRGA